MSGKTWVLASLVVSLWAGRARADKLQDFKDAVAATPGCDSIPYRDLSRTCDGKNDVMHEWCDGKRGPITCDVGTTRTIKDKLERERQNFEKLKERKHDLEDKRYHSNDDTEKATIQKDIDAVNREIEESERAINGFRDNLDKRKDFVSNAISTIETCVDHRRAIMNIFADALDKVRGESDDDIKPLARTLRDRFEEAKPGHEVAISGKQNARENCKSERP
ncbi:hypothetical protein BH11MYX1_BH11MYX1_42320 [soil metagenome]